MHFTSNLDLSSFPKVLGRDGWPWDIETDPKLFKCYEKWPKITIVTPSFNQAEFLEETIRSIILQNYPNLEYIIIDGGSNDNSIDIIKKYEKYLTYWISEKDYGQSHAINKGFAMATGEILNWINSDDILNENSLFEIGKAYLKNGSKYLIIIGNGYEINAFSIITKNRKIPYDVKLEPNFNFKIIGHSIQQSVFFSKNLLQEVGGINPIINYPMDMELQFKFAFIRPQVIIIDKFLASFRKHTNSKTISQSNKMLLEKINLLEYLKFYDDNQNYFKNQISSYIATFSFRGISFRNRIRLCRTFIINTPFNSKTRYKYKIVLLKFINK